MAKRNLDELRIGDGSETPSDERYSELNDPLQRTVRGSARWRTLLARGTAPTLAFFALGLVLFGSQRDTDYDLQLIAPGAAQSGDILPLRAFLYDNLRSVEGPKLSPRALDVQLEDRSGVTFARSRLEPSRAGFGDIEGSLKIPAALRGGYRLHALTPAGTVRVEVSRPLAIGEPDSLSVDGRPLRALQQFSEGPLQPEPGAVAPDVLRARVAGGACVPEEECRIFVHVGTPAANIWVEGNSTVTPQAPSQVTDPNPGVTALSIVTHGPEASLWLRASRAGVQVAHRSVRLPVALGASQLRLKAAVVNAGEPLSAELLSGTGGCIIDVFHAGQWLRTSSASSCAQQSIAGLISGAYRVQARRDPFSATTAGVAIAYVVGPKDTRANALRELARQASAIDPTDRFAKSVLVADDGALQLDAAGFGYLAAILESGIIEIPRAVSGYAATLEKLRHAQSQLRWLSVVALALGAISLALGVGRSGLAAVAKADAIMLDAGQTGPGRRRARARSMLSLALSLLSLMLVFVVLGAYVVARAGP